MIRGFFDVIIKFDFIKNLDIVRIFYQLWRRNDEFATTMVEDQCVLGPGFVQYGPGVAE
jgi:hypothetical protein